MGELVFARNRFVDEAERPVAQTSQTEFKAFDSAKFRAMAAAMEASARELRDIASKATVYASHWESAEYQEAYITMMLGPLAAIDRLRRRMTQT